MNLKEVKQRILSVKNTQKITSAMKLVSAAKLRRSQGAIEGMRPYQQKLNGIFSLSVAAAGLSGNPIMVSRDTKKAVIIPIASDTGLCGTFNSNIIRLACETIKSYVSQGTGVEVMPVGRKMADAVKKLGVPVTAVLMAQSQKPQYNVLATVALELMRRYLSGDIDKVVLVYTQFRSASRLRPVAEPLLPMAPLLSAPEAATADYIIEPGKEQLLESLLPKVVSLQLYTAFLDSVAAEHSARMMAMQAATDNANDLIAELTLEYNKGRQQAITNEMLDIVAGSNVE